MPLSEAFDLVDLLRLALDVQVLVDDAESTFPRDGDGEAGFGHGVHGSRDEGDVQVKAGGKVDADVDLGGQDVRSSGYEQDVVEGQSRGADAVFEARFGLPSNVLRRYRICHFGRYTNGRTHVPAVSISMSSVWDSPAHLPAFPDSRRIRLVSFRSQMIPSYGENVIVRAYSEGQGVVIAIEERFEFVVSGHDVVVLQRPGQGDMLGKPALELGAEIETGNEPAIEALGDIVPDALSIELVVPPVEPEAATGAQIGAQNLGEASQQSRACQTSSS